MHRFIARIFALLLSVLPVDAQELFSGPNPEWVQVLDIPTAPPGLLEQAMAGVLFLVSDEQISWEGDEKLTYFRTATQVTDRYGLESAATLTFTFDPAYESLTLTRLVVIRDGQVIDHTDTIKAEILRREIRLDDGILDGQLTVLLQVPDVRVGDVVDYAYLRRTLPAVDVANRSGIAHMEYDVPVVLTRVVVNWPGNWPIYISGWPARVAFSQTPQGDVIRHEWTRRDHAPLETEAMVPPGYSGNVTIQYSAFPDWSAIAGALSDYYMTSYPLGAEWDAKLRAIQAAHPNPEDRVIAALRAVQDELRYVSLSIGPGALFARLPTEVTAAGYGDCKDKALLLRTMLDKMGIEAYVALADLDEGHGLGDLKPALWSFDHAVVKVVVDGATYWMDPTASHEAGDLYSAVTPDYGYALPLSGADQQQLEPITLGYGSAWSSTIDEVYDFSLLGVYLTVTTIWDGPAANSFRQRLGATPEQVISEEYLDHYAAKYPGIRMLAPIAVTDDAAVNAMTVTERYLIPAPALRVGGLREDFEFAAADYTASLPDPQASARVAPMDLGAPGTYYHRVSVTGAPIDFVVPDGVSLYNDGFSYTFSGYAPASGELVLEWSFNWNNREVAAAAVPQVLADADVVADNAWFTWDLRPE